MKATPLSYVVRMAHLSLILAIPAGLQAATLIITDPLAQDTVGNTTKVQGDIDDRGSAHYHNYDTFADALSGFNASANRLVWTVDDNVSGKALGNFSNHFGSLVYTKEGIYKDRMTHYASDLTISMTDSTGAMRFATIGDDLSDHVLTGRDNPDPGGALLTLTFSENVAAFALTFKATRKFSGNVYDAATGGNLIGSFNVIEDAGESNLIWSAYEAGAMQGIGRVEMVRSVISNADYRIFQLGVVAIPEPSTYAFICAGSTLLLAGGTRRRRMH